ncbi:MAG: histidinol dehydrogenase [Saprospiraceae bacterium]
MKKYINPAASDWSDILKRPTFSTAHLDTVVGDVLAAVKDDGDAALRKFTERFDGVKMADFRVTEAEIDVATASVPADLKAAIQTAYDNIQRFHAAQQPTIEVVETMPGINCWRKNVAIDKVGLYIPGGTAPLFSTILMLGIPAKIAGCKEIVLCTPPAKDGSVNPAILFTAQLVGVTQIYKVGGSQAIAAMAYGTETIPQVYKIFGPGNQYVTAAKQLVNKQGTAIDMPAGPSEVLVCADDTANPAFVAADLLSQAEHGVDSQVVLVAISNTFIAQVEQEIEKQLAQLPRRDIAAKALENSVLIEMKDRQSALSLVNEYAAEHLILAVEDAEGFGEQITNAGSIFLGNYTPESVGDYASGTNHTLPTNGFARAYSGVSLDSFVKKITFQRLSKKGLQNIGKAVELMAAAEQLEAHKNAVTLRLATINKNES